MISLKITPDNFIRIIALVGIIMGALYLPFTPVYFPGSLSEGEIALWGFVTLILSVMLLMISFSQSKWRRLLFLLILPLMLLLNLGASILYFQYIPEGTIGPSPFQQFDPSFIKLLPHFIYLALVMIAFYILIKRSNRVESNTTQQNQK